MKDNQADIISRLDAMRAQEENTRCHDYFKSNACTNVKEDCRKAMVKWVQQVQKDLLLSPETAWVAMSCFDRYLSSGRGQSQEVLKSRCKFQLAAITTFYTAIKIYETDVLGLDPLIELCHGKYTESDFVSMERDILEALDWRVAIHTPIDFVRHLLMLLPELDNSFVSECLLEACLAQVEHAMSDLYLSCLKPSVFGISCLANFLADSDNSLPVSQKWKIWSQLSDSCHFDLSSAEIVVVRLQLPSQDTLRNKSNAISKLALLSQSHSVAVNAESSSPICVKKTAQQA